MTWALKVFEVWQSTRSNKRALQETVGFEGVVLANVQDLTVPIHEPENLVDSLFGETIRDDVVGKIAIPERDRQTDCMWHESIWTNPVFNNCKIKFVVKK